MNKEKPKEAYETEYLKSYLGEMAHQLRQEAGLWEDEMGLLANMSGSDICAVERALYDGDALAALNTIAKALNKKLVINFEALHQISDYSAGEDKYVTIEWAAKFLHTSEKHVNKLLDDHKLVYRGDKEDNKIYLETVIAYRQWKKIRDRVGMNEMSRMNQEMGLYDMDESQEEIIASIKETRREIAAEKARERRQLEQEPPSA
jgi:hypothetical protein